MEPANERKKLVVPCERTFSTCVVTLITELKEIKNREIGESCMEVSDLEREREMHVHGETVRDRQTAIWL